MKRCKCGGEYVQVHIDTKRVVWHCSACDTSFAQRKRKGTKQTTFTLSKRQIDRLASDMAAATEPSDAVAILCTLAGLVINHQQNDKLTKAYSNMMDNIFVG